VSDQLTKEVASTEQTPVETTTNAAQLLSEQSNQTSTTVEKPQLEESEFDIDLDEQAAPSDTGKLKFAKDKFKELDDDIDIEDDLELDERTHRVLDKVFNRAKEYKETGNKYKTIAEANTVIGQDDLIKTWDAHIKLPNDKLIHSIEFSKYKKAGFSDEEAAQKAAEYVEELQQESEKLYNRTADNIRLELSTAINERASEIHSKIQSTAKALSLSNAPDPNLITKATENLYKADNFLGLKFGGKSEQSKKDFVKPVAEAIKDGSLLKKIQSDPELLSEIGLFVQHRDKFKAAIERRTPAKKQLLESLSKAPHSSGIKPVTRETVSKEGGLKNPGGFK